MKLLILAALAATATCDFTCIKPVNPIPAGPPGACCAELKQGHLLKFLYTGKDCDAATLISEAEDGTTTYEACADGLSEACCDPLVSDISPDFNPACVLPE